MTQSVYVWVIVVSFDWLGSYENARMPSINIS